MKKVKLTDYPASILKGFSENAKTELAKQAIVENDYAGLKHVLDNSSSGWSSIPLYEALEHLDVKATQIIVDAMKKSDYESIKDGEYIKLSYLLRGKSTQEKILGRDEANAIKSQIIKILLEAKATKNISNVDLNILSSTISKLEFDDFCARKELDLTKEEFKSLDLSKYKYEAASPVLTMDASKPHSLVDLLLSRTYTVDFTTEQLKDIYVKLYNLDPMAKQMMTYMSTLIAKNNTIKLIFEKEAMSSYSPLDNVIKIDYNFQLQKVFNIESVLMHEIGHAVYDHLLDNEAQPFSMEAVKGIIPKYKAYLNDRFSSDNDIFSSTVQHKITTEEVAVKNYLARLHNYEKVAKLPIAKAAELLQTNAEGLEKYYYSQEYTEHFKFHSYIDLFFLNAINGLKHEDSDKILPDSTFNNILDIYLAEHQANTCQVKKSYTGFEEITATKEEIVKWAAEEYLPKLVKELALSPTQIHFLERIADYVARGSNWLDDNHNNSFDNSKEKYVELIVRALELELVPGMEPDIIESLQGLKTWHHANVFPEMHEAICSSNVYSLPFTDDMTAIYDCSIETTTQDL